MYSSYVSKTPEMEHALLDFSKPLQVSHLEQVVNKLYQGAPNEVGYNHQTNTTHPHNTKHNTKHSHANSRHKTPTTKLEPLF